MRKERKCDACESISILSVMFHNELLRLILNLFFLIFNQAQKSTKQTQENIFLDGSTKSKLAVGSRSTGYIVNYKYEMRLLIYVILVTE